MTLDEVLRQMGFDTDWVIDDFGIVLWERSETQPTELQLIAAGWIKPEPTPEEAPEE